VWFSVVFWRGALYLAEGSGQHVCCDERRRYDPAAAAAARRGAFLVDDSMALWCCVLCDVEVYGYLCFHLLMFLSLDICEMD